MKPKHLSQKQKNYLHHDIPGYSIAEERKRISEWLKKRGIAGKRGHRDVFAGNKERKELGE